MASASTLSFSRCRRSASRLPFGRQSLSRLRASASASSSSSVHACPPESERRRWAALVGVLTGLPSIRLEGSASEPGPTRSRAYQNVPHSPHEYQAIAQVLPCIGATCVAHSGQSISCGGFTGSAEGNLDAAIGEAENRLIPRSPVRSWHAVLVSEGKFSLGSAP